MAPRRKNAPPPQGVTRDQFAVWMGRDRHAVYEWGRKKAIVLFPDGTVNPIASCRAVDALRAGSTPAGDAPAGGLSDDDMANIPAALMVDPSLRSLPPSKLAHLVAMYRAEAARVALEKEKHLLIETSEAIDIFGRALVPAVQAIKNLPYLVGPMLTGIEDERTVIIKLEKAVNDVLRDISSIDAAGLLPAEAVPGAADTDGR